MRLRTTGLLDAATVATVAAFMLWPAIYNGYPLLYPDSALYIALSFAPQEYVPRGLAYPLLIGALHLGQSLWPIVLAQALLTAWLLHEVVAAFVLRHRLLTLLGLGLALALLTGLPWTVDQVMPDFLAGLLALAMALLLVNGDAFSRLRQGVLAATIALAVAVHPSHLAIALVMTVAGAAGLVWWRAPLSRLALPLVGIAGGVAVAMTLNLIVAGSAYYSKGGQQFLFGRMVDDGLVADYLEQVCLRQSLRLCDLQDRLPTSHNDYLWFQTETFDTLGGWKGSAELSHVMFDSMRLMPWRHLTAALADSARQLVTLKTGESMHPASATAADIVEIGFPKEAERFHSALQQANRLRGLIDILNRVQPGIALLALVLLPIGAAWLAWQGRRRLAGLAALAVVALAANAFTCGVFSGALDRYQNRIAWLAPAILVVVAADWRRGRHRCSARRNDGMV
jgi:hypothetical protein